MLQCEDYSIFIFGSEILIFFVKVIDDEGNGGRRIGQHVCYRRSTRTNKGDLQMECRFKKKVSPSTTDLYKPVPPPFAAPIPPSQDNHIVVLAFKFVQYHRPTEGEYDKKGIIVEEMDECTG